MVISGGGLRSRCDFGQAAAFVCKLIVSSGEMAALWVALAESSLDESRLATFLLGCSNYWRELGGPFDMAFSAFELDPGSYLLFKLV